MQHSLFHMILNGKYNFYYLLYYEEDWFFSKQKELLISFRPKSYVSDVQSSSKINRIFMSFIFRYLRH